MILFYLLVGTLAESVFLFYSSSEWSDLTVTLTEVFIVCLKASWFSPGFVWFSGATGVSAAQSPLTCSVSSEKLPAIFVALSVIPLYYFLRLCQSFWVILSCRAIVLHTCAQLSAQPSVWGEPLARPQVFLSLCPTSWSLNSSVLSVSLSFFHTLSAPLSLPSLIFSPLNSSQLVPQSFCSVLHHGGQWILLRFPSLGCALQALWGMSWGAYRAHLIVPLCIRDI